MTLRNRWARWTSVAVLVAALSLLAAACGGGGSKNSEGRRRRRRRRAEARRSRRRSRTSRLVYDTGIDYLDPAYSYTVEGWEIMWNVYLSLLGYKHVNGPDGATIVPALAKDLPQISSDGKTYTLTLRSGLKYSNGDAGQGERLQVRDQARLPRRLAGRRVLHEHRRRRRVLEDEEGRHLRDHGERRRPARSRSSWPSRRATSRTSSRRSSRRRSRRGRRRRISRRTRSRRRART